VGGPPVWRLPGGSPAQAAAGPPPPPNPTPPPRRPTPSRPSAPAASRSADWKFGFVGSAAEDGTVHLPPSPGDDHAVPMADAVGTIVTFTVDKLAYSLSPPVVFAVVDFDGGGRLPVELTDVDVADVAIGDRVELTFRRLFTADGIHNYFWKARPQRAASTPGAEATGTDETDESGGAGESGEERS
jgi:hydroxymethylglutaryl-CoA synthase